MTETLALTAIIVSFLALIIGGAALVLILSKMFSTHQLQYLPTPGMKDMLTPEEMGDEPNVTVEDGSREGNMDEMMQKLFNPSKEDFNDSIF